MKNLNEINKINEYVYESTLRIKKFQLAAEELYNSASQLKKKSNTYNNTDIMTFEKKNDFLLGGFSKEFFILDKLSKSLVHELKIYLKKHLEIFYDSLENDEEKQKNLVNDYFFVELGKKIAHYETLNHNLPVIYKENMELFNNIFKELKILMDKLIKKGN